MQRQIRGADDPATRLAEAMRDGMVREGMF